jgi:YD repeat-containing protein
VEESRAYDPAGRLASVTDAMGNTTCYAYTDDGLLSSVTRVSSSVTSEPCTSAPTANEYVEESDAYDAAGNMISQVTNNGATTTDYTVDAADRVARRLTRPGWTGSPATPTRRTTTSPPRPTRRGRTAHCSPPPTPTTRWAT